ARHWKVLIVVTAGAFLANLDLFIVNIAFPAIRGDFRGASLSELSWVLNGYAIVFAALPVPAGPLAHLVGGKRPFPRGPGALLGCLRSLRGRARRLAARGRRAPPGGGRGAHDPYLAGPAPLRVPPGAAGGCRRALDRRRRGGGHHWSDRGRPPRDRQLALGL